ncbi:hypothetical protein ACGTN6_20695, partial [Halomonas sp. THAF12]|uniref:hypothetical protein n=1 Tax=Halomonas sp. B23F22_10 TaxID=3459515 RepID=UPI00373F2EA9
MIDTNVLNQVFRKLPKERMKEVLKEWNPSWEPSKDQKRKKDYHEDFIRLSEFIDETEVDNFVEMAVTVRQVGLPAYTYKVENLDFLEHNQLENFSDEPFQNKYVIKLETFEEGDYSIFCSLRVKAYGKKWQHKGVYNTDSLTAVYKVTLNLNKEKKVLSIHAGNDHINDVVRDYILNIVKWP